MQKRMMFTLFLQNSVAHAFHGYWRHPDARSTEHKHLDVWIDLAIEAEKARFDAMFFADGIGMKGEFNGSQDIIKSMAVQFPVNDPSLLFPALARVTEHLGFVYTSSIIQQHPFIFARMASTLDHLTHGRIGWNIVTSATESAYRNLGFDELMAHDDRYAQAEEYVEVAYKLWEGSWDEGAVVNDRARGIYADPRKVHRIDHAGKHYRCEGPHLVEPSPQRTPVLFQAGSSPQGNAFKARHAEGAFISTLSPERSAQEIAKVRKLLEVEGRRPTDLLFLEGLTFVVGSTEAEARQKNEELDHYLSEEGQMAYFNSMSGIDLGQFDPATPLKDIVNEIPGIQGGFLAFIERAPAGTTPTIRDYLHASAQRFKVVGTPEMIADTIQAYGDAGVDGIQVMNIVLPGTFSDFFKHVVPILQKRGLMQTEYSPGTLREKMFPQSGPLIADTHPAARFRNAFAGRP